MVTQATSIQTTFYGFPSGYNLSDGAPQPANVVVLFGEELSASNLAEATLYRSEGLVTTYSVSPTYALRQAGLPRLIGIDRFGALDDESRNLLANVVGALDFGVRIDIEKTMSYSVLNE